MLESINILSPVGYNPNDINISNSVHLCDKNRYHPDEVFFKKKKQRVINIINFIWLRKYWTFISKLEKPDSEPIYA